MYSSYSNKPAIVRHSPFAELVTPGRHTVEFGVVAVEVQFRLEEEDVLPNERRISYTELSLFRPSHVLAPLEGEQLRSRPAWNPYLERRRLRPLASSYQSSWNVAAPHGRPWGGPPEEPCVS